MNSITRRFLGVDMLFEGGRMFVGAIGAAYLISRGVSLPQIATLKMIQAMVILIGEVPTGVLGDAL